MAFVRNARASFLYSVERNNRLSRLLKLLHTAHVGEILEIADVPILKSFLSLCHSAIYLKFRYKGTDLFRETDEKGDEKVKPA